MNSFLERFKIPTLLGLGVIVLGIGAGVYLTLQNQSLTTSATPTLEPQNITVSNIEDTSIAISWQTSSDIPSFLTYGQKSPEEHVVLDDRDETVPIAHSSHYVTIKNLSPQTTYQYKITSGKLIYPQVMSFTTAPSATLQSGLKPVIGSLTDNNQPVTDGIAYLSISGATLQSGLIKELGNFVIPLSFMRKENLSDIFVPGSDSVAKLTLLSGPNKTTVLFNLRDADQPLGPFKLGEEVDLTTQAASPSANINKYDLNGDGTVNSSDYSIVLQNFGNSPQNKAADLNGDGTVNEKDLQLIQDKIKENK